MTLETLLFDCSLIVFTIYVVSCIVKTTLKTLCAVSLIRGLEVVSTDFVMNQLPELIKAAQKKDCSCCGCKSPLCIEETHQPESTIPFPDPLPKAIESSISVEKDPKTLD